MEYGNFLSRPFSIIPIAACTLTFGGTRHADDGLCCQFPFIYKGQTHTRCVANERGGRPWCSLTGNYDADRRWGMCMTPIIPDPDEDDHHTPAASAGQCPLECVPGNCSPAMCPVECCHAQPPAPAAQTSSPVEANRQPQLG